MKLLRGKSWGIFVYVFIVMLQSLMIKYRQRGLNYTPDINCNLVTFHFNGKLIMLIKEI